MSLIYKKKEGLFTKRLEDGGIIVSMNKGFTDKNSSVYTINKTCKDIWYKINGIRSIHDITLDMSYKYNTPASEIKEDIEMLFDEFKKQGLIVEVW